jgi:hypothetical protein
VSSPIVANLKKYTLTLCIGSVLILSVSGLGSPLLASDTLKVERDAEKTVYTIGSSDKRNREEQSQQDRAWDMLMNMGIVVDRTRGLPAQSQPNQPPSK